MKYEIVSSSCRICLSKTKKLRSLYIPEDEDEPPCEMLRKVTGLYLEDPEVNDMLPKNICKGCYLSLNMAYAFRTKALKTHKILEIYLKSLQGRMHNVIDAAAANEHMEVEQNAKDELQSLEDYCLEDESLDEGDAVFLGGDCLEPGSQIEDYEDNIKPLFNQNTDRRNANDQHEEELTIEETANHEEQQIIEESDIVDLDYEQDSNDHEQYEYEQFQQLNAEETQDEPEDNSTVTMSNIKMKLSSKKESLPTGTTLRKSRTKRPELCLTDKHQQKLTAKREKADCCCDVCGNVFLKRSRMLEHRQTHFKELKYECELCKEKFHMRELLRKHMFSHGAGKPYKCQFCSRTFYYESVKKTHEAVHQGYKPFVCNTCGKAFAYAHALKKHTLIHAEIKLYRCNYCNKDFRLQHHMKQHELTRMHQNAVRAAESSRGGSSHIVHEFSDVVLADNENSIEFNDHHQIIVES